MESEQRGRASRASSTSSLGREVRCGCQYYQSDSLLPERRALLGRPPSRTMQQPPAVRCSEHEYEPIAAPSPLPQPLLHLQTTMTTAPVVRITDTDVVHVADSDDSIDDRSRLPPELTKDGGYVLPLDGKIEDNAMEARELVEAGDTSEELETPQELQDRLEERFLNAATPGTESRTDGEVNTSQVDSVALEELPLRRGARGLPQRIRTQAGKLRSRLRGIQRPTFAFAERQKSEKPRSTSSGRSEKSRTEKRPSRMERIRSSFSERPRLSLPSRPKFNLPDRSKFRLPQRPKFHLPERAKFHLPDRPKFNIKKPNIRLPSALSRIGMSTTTQDEQQRSTEPTVGSRRNIFDFSTYPQIFSKKSTARSSDFTTSTPKDSRGQSAGSATFPRAKNAGAKWVQDYDENAFMDEDSTVAERTHPWRRPSLEEPRLSVRLEREALAAALAIPWEEKRRRNRQEEFEYMDYELDSGEISERPPAPKSQETSKNDEESFEPEQIEPEPIPYDDRDLKEEMMMPEDFRPIQRSRSLDEQVSHLQEDESYESSFARADRGFAGHKMSSEEYEEEEYEEDIEADEEREPSSAQSDREQQQSSGSSCDRRRRGVIEEVDSDEFFLRQGVLNQNDINLEKYLTTEIRDNQRYDATNALADDAMLQSPPQRPMRARSLRNRKEGSMGSYDVIPPLRPKRERTRRQVSTESGDSRDRTRSESRHRVVYQAEGTRDATPAEPLDDIVVVKPIRRKSKSSQRSQSQIPTDTSLPESGPPRPPSPKAAVPPVVPTRRKRTRRETVSEQRNGDVRALCNGHASWSRPASMPPISREFINEQDISMTDDIAAFERDTHRPAIRSQVEEYIEPVPVPPKRRSRSRGTSVAQDEDRTSHGAESLPELGYIEDDIPRDEEDSMRDLSGYAIVEKRDKPTKPQPPRRRRNKFATMPKSAGPKRPQRAYSTLGPPRSKASSGLSESLSGTLEPADSAPYIDIDPEDVEHRGLRSGEVLSKMQGRPLPAPPRPPRNKKDRIIEHDMHSMQEYIGESTTATQTDPLPDDMIIEEEVTQAKLVVAPSTSGSQILVSTERIPSPIGVSVPPVPPLPMQRLRRDDQLAPSYDTVSLTSPSPIREHRDMDARPHLSAPHLEEPDHSQEASPRFTTRTTLSPEETLKVASLEVGDLRVDRLSVSQIDAGKIIASEVDALVITASELKGVGTSFEEALPPSIIKELIAIRSHLETVAASQTQQSSTQSVPLAEEPRKRDIPPMDESSVPEKAKPEEDASLAATEEPGSRADEKSEPREDQKVVKREVIEAKNREIPITHTLSVVQLEATGKETTLTHTLSVPQTESDLKEIANTYSSPSIVRDTQDKSFQILDSETPISLTSSTAMESGVEKHSSDPREDLESTRSTLLARYTSRGGSTISPVEMSPSQVEDEPMSEDVKALIEELKKDSHSAKETTGERSIEREKSSRKSRSRSPSPIKGMSYPVRQTASPVRSVPPAISVTPDMPDTSPSVRSISNEPQPQRAIISYSSRIESQRESVRESSQSPLPQGATHFIAFPASQIPTEFFSLNDETVQRIETEPTVSDTALQLLRALRHASIRTMRQFVGYISSLTTEDESDEKIREVELALCALLLLVAGLLVYFFSNPRIVTHHHHWDYINPPQ